MPPRTTVLVGCAVTLTLLVSAFPPAGGGASEDILFLEGSVDPEAGTLFPELVTYPGWSIATNRIALRLPAGGGEVEGELLVVFENWPLGEENYLDCHDESGDCVVDGPDDDVAAAAEVGAQAYRGCTVTRVWSGKLRGTYDPSSLEVGSGSATIVSENRDAAGCEASRGEPLPGAPGVYLGVDDWYKPDYRETVDFEWRGTMDTDLEHLAGTITDPWGYTMEFSAAAALAPEEPPGSDDGETVSGEEHKPTLVKLFQPLTEPALAGYDADELAKAFTRRTGGCAIPDINIRHSGGPKHCEDWFTAVNTAADAFDVQTTHNPEPGLVTAYVALAAATTRDGRPAFPNASLALPLVARLHAGSVTGRYEAERAHRALEVLIPLILTRDME